MRYPLLLVACATALVACDSHPSAPEATPVALAPSLAKIRVDQTFELTPFLVQNTCEPEPVLVSGSGRIIQRGTIDESGTRLNSLIYLSGSGEGTLTGDDYGFSQIEWQRFRSTSPTQAEGENLTQLRLDREDGDDLYLLTRMTFTCDGTCTFQVNVLKSICGDEDDS